MNMQETKGRVVDIQGNSIILLTSHGEFIQRPLPQRGIMLGEEITVPSQGPNLRLGPLVSLASAAAVIAFLLVQSVGTMAAPVYYVHVDIEPGTPSVELALSKNMRVVEATALNDEGTRILGKTQLGRKSVENAIENLVETAENMEYIVPDKESALLISIAGKTNGIDEKKKQLIREVEFAASKQLKASKAKATLGIAAVDNRMLQKALDQKSSINYMLFNKQSAEWKKAIPKEYKTSQVVPGQWNKKNEKKAEYTDKKKQSVNFQQFKHEIKNQKTDKSNFYSKYAKKYTNKKTGNNIKDKKTYTKGNYSKSNYSKLKQPWGNSKKQNYNDFRKNSSSSYQDNWKRSKH